MNAAEITDKLGLHSLRQRAWVSYTESFDVAHLLTCFSISNPPVPPLVTVFTKALNGSATHSERRVTTRLIPRRKTGALRFNEFDRQCMNWRNCCITILPGPLEQFEATA